jgi:D-glycero-D-manno-heptose 1,7-bisphosphate phosphatase
MAERVLVLDRDGVINEDSDDYIKGPEEWQPIPGSIEAIARLCHGGYRICVASNQSGIARGLFGLGRLNAMHQKLRELLAKQGGQVELIAFCPHSPADHCLCRKPRPGLLLEIGSRLGIPLSGIPFVGDSIVDVEAARAAGMSPWLVRTGKGERTLAFAKDRLSGVLVFRDLGAVADHALGSGLEP